MGPTLPEMENPPTLRWAESGWVWHAAQFPDSATLHPGYARYQLKVVVKDMDAYQALLLNRITRIEGITGVHSSFVLRRVIDKTALPVAG